ncbi:MAG: OmpH family outer membrane protein [Candidatus Eisenbacteria bacterium]|uniref:OmpH family outer membrane protein n=1 Tax=Eiseniibacteriota bacterium TaxID=2212470 RepID=A0A9D6L5B4_UNCEI|nr:OmpH family outer membrane protein [Candidatus Eisenbacteria bacterium]MBI3540117.1 OmpH family outer membrane protein [Candidatus Eisenbacteria bacterium]
MGRQRRRPGSGPRVGWAALALLLAAAPARAADLRIGFIDSGRIFQEYADAKEAQGRFDRQVQGWRDEAGEKEKAVRQLRTDVRDMSPILSSLKRQEKEVALQKGIEDYERFVQSIWGPQGRAALENTRATQDVVNQIRAVVEKLAGERGLDLVFDAAGGYIIYADKSLDLTAEVIRRLNERSTSGAAH